MYTLSKILSIPKFVTLRLSSVSHVQEILNNNLSYNEIPSEVFKVLGVLICPFLPA